MNIIVIIILIFSFSCDDPVVEGCTSFSACNFNPEATKSNGNCIQPQGCNDWCPDDNGSPGELDCVGVCSGNSIVDECGECIDPECNTSTESDPYFTVSLNPCTENDVPTNI